MQKCISDFFLYLHDLALELSLARAIGDRAVALRRASTGVVTPNHDDGRRRGRPRERGESRSRSRPRSTSDDVRRRGDDDDARTTREEGRWKACERARGWNVERVAVARARTRERARRRNEGIGKGGCDKGDVRRREREGRERGKERDGCFERQRARESE